MADSILAKNIERLRKQKNLTQKQLAKELNISPSTLSNYETEQRNPDIAIITNIAKYFQITIDDLMTNENVTIAGSVNHPTLSKATNSIKYYQYETQDLKVRFIISLVFVLCSMVVVFLIPITTEGRNNWFLALVIYFVFVVYFLFTDRNKLIHLVNINEDEQLICVFPQNKELQKANQRNVLLLTASTLLGLFASGVILLYLNEFYTMEELSFYTVYLLVIIIVFVFILYKNLASRYVKQILYTDFISRYGLFKYKFLMMMNELNFYFLITMMIIIKDNTYISLQVLVILLTLSSYVVSSYLWVQNITMVRRYQLYRMNTKTNDIVTL